jgi:nitrate reductase alpha subunit
MFWNRTKVVANWLLERTIERFIKDSADWVNSINIVEFELNIRIQILESRKDSNFTKSIKFKSHKVVKIQILKSR